MSVTDLTLESKATRWGEAVAAASLTKRPINYIPNSTYNEHLDILPNAHMGTNEIPSVQWVGMGVGSDYMKNLIHPIGKDVISNPTNYIHKNSDAIPFIPMPYAMRKEGEDDLPTALRNTLSNRALMIVDGVRYWGWFLKAVEKTSDKVGIDVVTTDGGGNVIETKPLEPSVDPLNPKRDPNFVGESGSSNEYLQVRSPILLSLSPGDISEILNAASILFSSSDIEITEFSLVAGIPKSHVVTDGGRSITYTEVIGAQSTHFSKLSFGAAQRVDVGVDIGFKIGHSMPIS